MPFLTAALAFVLPLILAPRLLFYYDITPKVAILMLAAALALAALCFQLDSWIAFARTRWGRWYLASIAASMLITGIAAWRSAEPALAWYGSNWRRMGVLTEWATLLAAAWVAQYAVSSRQRLLWLLRAISAAGFLASLYGVAQYLGWDPVLPRDAYGVGEGIYRIVRPPGTLGHSDYFAAFLVWPVFAASALSIYEQARGWKWFAAISAVAGAIAIVLSGSRGALLALIFGAVVRVMLKRPPARLVAACSLAVIVSFAVFYISPAGERLRARVHWIGEDAAGGARLLLWRDSVTMAAAKPLIGYGPEAFSADFPKFESVALARAYPDFYHESPHNLPLDVLTSEGLFGLLALGVAIFAAIAGGVQARKRNHLAVLAFLPGLAATLVAHQFAVLIAPTAFFLYLGAGILAGAATEEPAALAVPRYWRAAALVAGVAAAVALTIGTYRLVSQDYLLATVQRRMDAGDLTGAVQAYRTALSRPDFGVTGDLYFSRRWSKIAMESPAAIAKIYYSQIAAGAATRSAHEPEELQNAWYNLAILAAARNDASGTEFALRAAVDAAPNWYKPRWILARLLSTEGRSPEAALEAGRAIELNSGKDPEVASTLAQVLRSAAAIP